VAAEFLATVRSSLVLLHKRHRRESKLTDVTSKLSLIGVQELDVIVEERERLEFFEAVRADEWRVVFVSMCVEVSGGQEVRVTQKTENWLRELFLACLTTVRFVKMLLKFL
jgi:hypothetical protein